MTNTPRSRILADERSRSVSRRRPRVRAGAWAVAALAFASVALAPTASARVWHPALDLAAPGGDPSVAMDAAGNALIVWTTEDPDHGAGRIAGVRGVLRDRAGTFVDLGELSDAPSVSDPRVVMNQAGDAVAIWLHTDAVTRNVVVQGVVGTSDGDFSEPFTLSDEDEDARGAALAINRAGDAVVVWTGDQMVQAAVLTADGSLSIDDVARGNNPRPGIDAAGNATVVWEAGNGVQAATRPPGGAFSTPVDVSAPDEAYLPDIAVDPAGNAVVVWRTYDDGSYALRAAARPAGGSFSAPVGFPDAIAGSYQRVGIDQFGTATAVWNDGFGLGVVTHQAGAGFSPPSRLASSARHMELAVDPAGAAVVAWAAPVGDRNVVQASVRAAGSAFEAPVTLSAVGITAIDARVAIEPSGNAIAVWQLYGGVVQMAIYDDSPLPQPPPPAPTPAGPQPASAPPCSDCPGTRDAATTPRLRSTIAYASRALRRGTTFTKLTVKPVSAGTTIRVRCSGRGCPWESKTVKVAKDAPSRNLLPLLKHRRLRPGAELEVRLTKRDTVGLVRRLRIRGSRQPRSTVRCVAPNASTTFACPR